MKNISLLLIVLSLALSQTLIAQEVVDFDDPYINDNLIYKVSTYSLFTSSCERRLKNGKLTYSCQYNGKKKHGREFCYSKEDELVEL